MKKRVKFRNFNGGLHLGGGADEIPINHVRRNRGIHPLADKIFKSRNGSTQLHALNDVHSLIYYKDVWYSGASTLLYKEATQIKSGLSGDRLSFVKIPPVAGIEDYLFATGGDELFKVGDENYRDGTELITNGTMEADANWANYGTPATNERSTAQIYLGSYSRKFTPNAANEGIQGDAFTTVALTWYTATCYVYPDDGTAVRIRVRNGANDAWAYNTLHSGLTQDVWNEITFTYQELTGKGGAGAYIVFESDTATSGDWYTDDASVQLSSVVTNWGIDAPAGVPTVAVGAAGSLTGDYLYRATFRNSKTGTRSNAPSPEAVYSLLLHCNGSDASTTFTDNGGYGHTATAAGNAQLDTAQKKFGSASGLFDGTGDKLTIPSHYSFQMGSSKFTADFWVRFNSVAKTQILFDHSSSGAPGRWGCVWSTGVNILQFHTSASGGSGVWVNASWSPSANTWYHIAIIRGWGGDPDTFAVCVDGTVLQTETSVGWTTSAISAAFYIGSYYASGTYDFDGWIDEFRIVKGSALWTENFTAPAAESADADSLGAVTLSSEQASLSNIPVSTDDQVDEAEIWRTVAGGSSFFRLIAIDNGTTTFTDNVPDADLESIELPTDNIKPYSWFDDCIGPYNASMFILSRSQGGERGRLYYSPVGRAEIMQGFINVCGDDEPLQKGVVWKGYIYLFGEGGIYQVYGTNPYFSREVDPVGTTKPHTVIVTTDGIAYEAEDGPRLFDGNKSRILKPDSVDLIFRGEAIENLSAFSGVVADFGRGEYVISDESQTLAYHFAKRRWRDIGLGFKSLHYAKDADILGGGTSADGIYDIENEGTVEDNSTDISMAIETEHHRIGEDAGGIVEHVHIDANAGSETLTIVLIHDGTATTLGTLATASRSRTTFMANKFCREFGIRITGTIDAAVNIYGADADVYTSREESI